MRAVEGSAPGALTGSRPRTLVALGADDFPWLATERNDHRNDRDKRAALHSWAVKLEQIVSGESARAKVVPLRGLIRAARGLLVH